MWGALRPSQIQLSKKLVIERFHFSHSDILGIDVAGDVVLGADIAAAVTKNSTQIFDVHIGWSECGIGFAEQVRMEVIYSGIGSYILAPISQSGRINKIAEFVTEDERVSYVASIGFFVLFLKVFMK